MNVAVVAAEAVPFAKTGGLADVAGALPRALERLGVRATLFIPFHRRFLPAHLTVEPTGLHVQVPIGGSLVEGQIHRSRLPGSNVDVYLVDQRDYFDRDGLYQRQGVDFRDNCARFAFFNRAVLEAVRLLDIPLDLIHCNDWQTGLIPLYLKEHYSTQTGSAATGTLFTIHNLAYQGAFPYEQFALLGLDDRLFHWEALEFHGRFSFLKAGLVFADTLTTVSPTYAREIQTPELGCGLDGLLRHRRDDLRGIVNGIDSAVWRPTVEPMIAANYDAATVAVGKPLCKAHLQRRASLPERDDVPLLAQIGRLDPQKGWDLLIEVADELLCRDVQLVVLGQGQPHYHERLDRLAARHPGKLRVFLEFSSTLAHQIEAGADVFLMPSLYEPCGLNQLYSLAHGTVPVVRRTGGLADTVVDATPDNIAAGTANGVVFDDPNADALRDALQRTLNLYNDRQTWVSLIQAGMRADWSWDRSAREYLNLYQHVARRVQVRE